MSSAPKDDKKWMFVVVSNELVPRIESIYWNLEEAQKHLEQFDRGTISRVHSDIDFLGQMTMPQNLIVRKGITSVERVDVG